MSGFYTPENYRVKSSIGYWVRRASAVMIAAVESAFSSLEITFVQWLVLANLRDGEATTAAELCRDICYDSGALTRLIDQLVERGFVTREKNADDRRTVNLRLTKFGLERADALTPLVTGLLNKALIDFTPAEIETLTSLLMKLAHGIEAAPKCDKSPLTERLK